MSLEWVAPCLKALGFQNRLELLPVLREERTLAEINLERAVESDRDGGELTRQGIQYHLDKLRETGLVEVSKIKEDGRIKNTYWLDRSQLFSVAEALVHTEGDGSLGRGPPRPGSAPLAWQRDRSEPKETGPHLVLVHGPDLGRTFPLRDIETREGRGWMIGRGSDAEVQIAEDPYLDPQAVELVEADEGFVLHALRSAEGSTAVNGDPIDFGGRCDLAHGDVISVGRSLLLFRN